MNSKSEKKISLTKAELAIMQVLWQNTDSGAAQGFSAREINQALPEKQWQRTTLATMLARLEEKGAVHRQSAANDLLDTLYHGSVRSLAASLVASRRLSAQDIDELRELFKL